MRGEASIVQGGKCADLRLNWFVSGIILLFVATVPIEFMLGNLIDESFSLSKISGLIMAAIWLEARRSSRFRIMPGTWLVVVFGAISVLSAVMNDGDISSALSWFLTTLMLVLSSNIVYDYLLQAKSFEPFYWAIALGTTVIAALMVLPLGLGFLEVTDRRTFMEFGENGMGATLASGALCHLILLSRRPLRINWWTITHSSGAALCVVALVMTGSRGAAIAFLFGLIVLGISKSKGRFRWSAAILSIVVAGFIIWLQFSVPVARLRWERTLFGYGGPESQTSERLEISKIAIPMFLERPFLGWSIGPAMKEIGGPGLGGLGIEMDTHNSLFWILLDAGLLGLLPFSVVIFIASRASIRAMRGPEGGGPAALLGLILIFSMTVTWHYRKPLWLFIPLAIAAMSRSKRRGAVTG